MANRRVVVTGLGSLACNGSNLNDYWGALKEGRHGIGPTQNVDVTDHTTKFSAEVKLSNIELAELFGRNDEEKGAAKRTVSRKDRFVLLAIAAAEEAIRHSGLDYSNWADPFKVGCIFGAGIGGLDSIETEYAKFKERGPRRISPLLVPKMIVDSAAGDISIRYNAKGPNYCITTACASASHSIGAAFHMVRNGLCDVMISGGTEAPITDLGIGGFNAMKALSTRNDSPETASRPFDADRDGFVIAEAAGALILEELEHAKARGANILGEVVGHGCTGDAHHETAPDPSGAGGVACMQMALRDAGINPEDVGYVNAHGTSTKYNDAGETTIIKKVFGDHAYKMKVSSTKSMTGHSLGAAGGIEAVASIMALRDGVLPPTINYQTPDPECDLDYVPNAAQEVPCEYALSNNLGFGGHNASIIFKRFA